MLNAFKYNVNKRFPEYLHVFIFYVTVPLEEETPPFLDSTMIPVM